jgi:hypothetical protein
MSKIASSTLILVTGNSNDDIPLQKQNISIGNATRILNEPPIDITIELYIFTQLRGRKK